MAHTRNLGDVLEFFTHTHNVYTSSSVNLIVCDVLALQVECVARNLNSGDVFVLVTPTAVHAWYGKHSSVEERDASIGVRIVSPNVAYVFWVRRGRSSRITPVYFRPRSGRIVSFLRECSGWLRRGGRWGRVDFNFWVRGRGTVADTDRV